MNDETTKRTKVACAWCGLVLDEGAPGALTSHGICRECRAAMMEYERTGLTHLPIWRGELCEIKPPPVDEGVTSLPDEQGMAAAKVREAAGMRNAATDPAYHPQPSFHPQRYPQEGVTLTPSAPIYRRGGLGVKARVSLLRVGLVCAMPPPPPRDDDIGRRVRISFDDPGASARGLDFSEVDSHGHRWDQLVFSAYVAGACACGGFALGCALALWHAWAGGGR